MNQAEIDQESARAEILYHRAERFSKRAKVGHWFGVGVFAVGFILNKYPIILTGLAVQFLGAGCMFLASYQMKQSTKILEALLEKMKR